MHVRRAQAGMVRGSFSVPYGKVRTSDTAVVRLAGVDSRRMRVVRRARRCSYTADQDVEDAARRSTQSRASARRCAARRRTCPTAADSASPVR